ncbi:SDR family oxidoreductase [bacterium]|nr:SDR family oxidoreductase [bacterium]MBU1636627.1 SDR family oxidoreductase [bacterium]
MSNEVFLTGTTGYIGSHILHTWLEKTDHFVHVLSRGKREQTANERIESAMREIQPDWSLLQHKDRVRVVEGDLTLEKMGIESNLYSELLGRVTEIIHCAAAARFDLPLEDARKTNVGGVESILSFAAKCSNIERVDYVGTAYVAGLRDGVAYEDELDIGQTHRNTYEQSKYEAELLLREWMPRLPITVSRPSIVICDSRTGQTSSHNGFYRAVNAYVHHGLSKLPGEPSSIVDLVPVDYVCEALYQITRKPETVGQTYQLTAGTDAVTLSEIQEMSARYSNRPKFEIVRPEEMQVFLSSVKPILSEKQLKLFEEMERYTPYLICQTTFDNTNCKQDTGLQAPLVKDYYLRFIKRILVKSKP